MSVKEFDKTFGLETSIEEEKKRFIIRIENSLFDFFQKSYSFMEYEQLFKKVCYQLGEDAIELIGQNSYLQRRIPDLSALSKKDFVKTMRVAVALYKTVVEHNPNTKIYIANLINDALEKASLNLGVKWADGVFYPTGDKLLDKELIDTSLSLLDKFPNEKTDLKNALDNYNAKSLYGVVENCYIAVEGISRQLLNNKKTLDRNREELIGLLKFSKYWDEIYLNYLKYAHEYRRHAGENRHDLKPEEVEGFLYMTCLIIRATLRSNENSAIKLLPPRAYHFA